MAKRYGWKSGMNYYPVGVKKGVPLKRSSDLKGDVVYFVVVAAIVLTASGIIGALQQYWGISL